MTRPQRLTFRREKGFDLQAVSRACNGLPARMVTRPGKWGNPFAVAAVARRWQLEPGAAHDKAISLYRDWMAGTLPAELEPDVARPSVTEIRAELAGYNLACWCKAGETCHADLLIEIANP